MSLVEDHVVDGRFEHVRGSFDQPLAHHERRLAGGVSADLNGARTRTSAAATQHRVTFDQAHTIERQAQFVADDAGDRAVVMLSGGRTAELDQRVTVGGEPHVGLVGAVEPRRRIEDR